MGEATVSRALLKVSGEALAGEVGHGIDPDALHYVADHIVAAHALGSQIAVVCGGGNIVRGGMFSKTGTVDRTVADQMGMLATSINALALQGAVEKQGVPVRVQNAITMSQVAEPFIRRRAIRHLEKGRVVIFAGGTGNPYFTTDTAGVLRALEIEADVVVKATNVDGIYDKDPRKHDDAVKYETLDYATAIDKRLAVMDQTAFTLCQEHDLPIVVLDLNAPGSVAAALKGERVGTLVGGKR